MKDEVKNGIITCVCVIFILIVVYFTTAVFLTGEIGSSKKSKFNDGTEKQGEVSNVSNPAYSNMIIAGNTFDQAEDNYMVLFFSESKASDVLKNAITSYDSGEKDIKLYKVNTDEAINKYVKSNLDNTSPIDSKDLKVSGNALMSISKKGVSSYITDESQIISALK